MGIADIVGDSLFLYKDKRFDSAFALSLIALEATAKLRYANEEHSSKRFKCFLNDEIRTASLWPKVCVDLPPEPVIAEFPRLKLPELTRDNFARFKECVDQHMRDYDAWQRQHEEAYEKYRKAIKDVGDNFCGPKDVYLHEHTPRLVTTTGILYQARCELVHEGNLSRIRVVPSDEDDVLRVSGANPIEFSSTWILRVLGIVASAKENAGLFDAKEGE